MYNLSGRLVGTITTPVGELSVAMPQGVYVVRAGSMTEKVVVN